MCSDQHAWKPTYVLSRDKHADIGIGGVRVWYVRCERCGQIGFTRGRSKIVYTGEQ